MVPVTKGDCFQSWLDNGLRSRVGYGETQLFTQKVIFKMDQIVFQNCIQIAIQCFKCSLAVNINLHDIVLILTFFFYNINDPI